MVKEQERPLTWVVVGVYKGVVDTIDVRFSEEDALKRRDEVDKELGIERDDDGNYDSENDCVLSSPYDGSL